VLLFTIDNSDLSTAYKETSNISAVVYTMATSTSINRYKFRILITGSSGYLGQHILKSLVEADRDNEDKAGAKFAGFDITAAFGTLSSFPSDCVSLIANSSSTLKVVDKVVFDCTNETSLKEFFNTRDFEAVIHLAAISSPFVCEKDPKEAQSTNCPVPLLKALHNKNGGNDGVNERKETLFIFLSTDQVYDGFHAPYLEKDGALPINEYGKSKLAFEGHLLKSRPKIKPIILRSSLILGGVTIGNCRKQSFVQFVHDRLSNRQVTDFYTNEFRNVVFVDDVVKVISHFVRRHSNGDDDYLSHMEDPVYNMGGKDKVSRFEIAQMVAEVCGLDKAYCNAIEKTTSPISSQSLNPEHIIVKSPPDIAMNSTKLEKLTGISMLGLKDMVDCIFATREEDGVQ